VYSKETICSFGWINKKHYKWLGNAAKLPEDERRREKEEKKI